MSGAADRGASESPRRRIFAAADRLFRERGVARTNVDEIAEAAGVSRATLYRHVTGGRDEIVRTVIADNTEEYMRRELESIAAQTTEFDERLVRMFVVLDSARRADEANSAMFELASMGAMVAVEGWTEAAVGVVQRVIEPVLADARTRGEVAEGMTDHLVAEWLVRQFASLELLRSPLIDDPAGFETYVRTLVVRPLLDRQMVAT